MIGSTYLDVGPAFGEREVPLSIADDRFPDRLSDSGAHGRRAGSKNAAGSRLSYRPKSIRRPACANGEINEQRQAAKAATPQSGLPKGAERVARRGSGTTA